MKNKNTCADCPHAWSNFNNLSEKELQRVSDNRHEADFKKGEIIYKKGTHTLSAIFIAKGVVKLYNEEDNNNKGLILALGKQGNFISGPGMFIDSLHHFSASAITDVKACFIKAEFIKQLINQNPSFAQGYIKVISQKQLDIYNKMSNLLKKKMHGRLAEGILWLANELDVEDEFELSLSRKELGEMTGMVKENVVRILKEFTNENIIILEGHNLKILNKQRLEMISIKG